MDPRLTLELTFIRGDLEAVRKWLKADGAPHQTEIGRLNCALEALARIDALSPASLPQTQTEAA